MAHAGVEPELIDATEDEQAAVTLVARFLEHVADTGRTLPRLVDPDGSMVELSPSVVRLLRTAVHHLAQGQAVTLVPLDKELTTQQAANLLTVSRPFLVKLLEQGEIPFTKTGTHRRIRFADLIAYKLRRDARRGNLLDQLTSLSQELGLYDR